MNFRKPMLAAAALFLTAGAVACSTDLIGPPTLDDAQINADIASTSGDAIASQVTSFGDDVAAAGSFSMVAPSYKVQAEVNRVRTVYTEAPRGRIRFDEQLRRRLGISPPIEVHHGIASHRLGQGRVDMKLRRLKPLGRSSLRQRKARGTRNED